MKSKYGYLAKNTVLFTLSSFGSKLLAFLLVPFYTAVLSTEEYGMADLITTTSNLLIFVVTICIADAVLRFAIDNSDMRQGVFGFGLRVVILGNIISGSLILLVAYINPFHWNSCFYIFLFFTILTNALNQLVSNYLRAIDKILPVAVMGILVTAVTVSCNLLLLLVFKLGVEGYLFSFIAGYFFASIYGFYIIFRNDPKSFIQICDKQTQRQMVLFAFPLIFNGVAWWINNSLDRYYIIFYCGVAVNGLYAVASKIPTILTMINQIFNQAWNLSAIKEFDAEDKSGFFSNIYCLYNFVLVSGCSVIILFNIPLARLLFSKDFFVAWNYSSVLVITAVFAALSGYFGSVFVAVKNSKIFAISTVLAAFVNALLNWVLIPTFGALGGAVATAVSFFIIWLIRYIIAKRYIKMKIHIIRDLTAYVLIIFQTVLEHMDDHVYPGQVTIFIVIIILYRKEIIQFTNKVVVLIKKSLNTKK